MNAPSGFALYRPRAIEVEAPSGRPRAIAGRSVESVREDG